MTGPTRKYEESPRDTSKSGSSVYDAAYSMFFERHYTGWVRQFSPELERYLAGRNGGPGLLLDLCCGSGETLGTFLHADWTLIGVDLSAEMLRRAQAKLEPALRSGRLRLVHADAVELPLETMVDAVVSLDGALNHLMVPEHMQAVFNRVGRVLRPGGRFLFDLFEPTHFRHWNNLSVTDSADVIMLKRGSWDGTTGVGRRRISGAFHTEDGWQRVAQDLTARYFEQEAIADLLAAAGLRPVPVGLDMPPCPCGSGDHGPCRVLFEAVRESPAH